MSVQKNQPDDRKWQYVLRWSGLGIEFCGVVGLFSYFGYKLDEKFRTSPWLLLAGFFIGFVGMLYLIFKETRNIWRD